MREITLILVQAKQLVRMKSVDANVKPGSSSPALAGAPISKQSSDSKILARPGQPLARTSSVGGQGQSNVRRSEQSESPSPAQSGKGGGKQSQPQQGGGSAKKGMSGKTDRPPVGKIDSNTVRAPQPSRQVPQRADTPTKDRSTPTDSQQQQPRQPPSADIVSSVLGADSSVVVSDSDMTATPSPAPSPAVDIAEDVPEVLNLSDEECEKRVNSLVEEYITLRDSEEFGVSMRELPVSATGFIVLRIMSKFLDTPKADTKAKLTVGQLAER
jgi:hypothetical protein